MTAASLFSGVGAPELAMPGWDWLWHAEIEKFPSAVMAERFPHSVNLGDVTADDFIERALAIGRPDVLVFGSPCQSFSVAGQRLGLDDPRGNLALVALRIVARIKPRWFLFENVPGLLSSSSGSDFGIFLRTVEECGYSLCWSVLDAQYFGLAQRRKRVFAVGSLGDWRGPAAVLLEPESLCGDSAPSREAGEGTAAGIASSPAVGFQTSQSGCRLVDTHATLDANNGSRRHNGVTIFNAEGSNGFTLTRANIGKHVNNQTPLITHALRGNGFDARQPDSGTTPALSVGQTVAVAFAQNQVEEVRTGDVANTLNTNFNAPGRNTPMAFVDNPDAEWYNRSHYGEKAEAVTVEALRVLFHAADQEEMVRWCFGILAPFWPQEVLRPEVHGVRVRREAISFKGLVYLALSRPKGEEGWAVRTLWAAGCTGCPPSGWEPYEQCADQLRAYLSLLPQSPSPTERFLRLVWQASEGFGLLREALSAVQEARRSACLQHPPSEDVPVWTPSQREGAVRPALHASQAVRRLQVEECEALQGFPRSFTAITYRGKLAADGPRYKAIGNSMAVPVVRWILSRLEIVDGLLGARTPSGPRSIPGALPMPCKSKKRR